MLLDLPSEDFPTVENHAHCTADQNRCQATIDILPEDALIYVFDFYIAQASGVEAWHTLVHVCRRWQILVFGSRHRLNLRIECTGKTRFREKLDIWQFLPALPIVVSGNCDSKTCLKNIKAILQHRDRACQINLDLTWELDLIEIFTELEKPFPVLTALEIYSDGSSGPLFPNPNRFLGGSTHLRSLSLTGIPIPKLPKLLLSSTDLVNLQLKNTPLSGTFSPGAMVTALSVLTRLKVLHFTIDSDYRHRRHIREHRQLPMPTRTVLPLTTLRFEGVNEYLENFMERIDSPLLEYLDIL